ncbi:zf-HC2 domain-containing protein [Nocardiopsis sp. FIRDI 009]|uniref:zf-HC2 domain-containing protein n=1 Tax=Nocardiopsis sp. FIRDI 009 TaxID=714197 RepID=UPI000E272C03|nr:zf-HC2 domain-containing protein [Nocardiopsis sp. FIRDI 009]
MTWHLTPAQVHAYASHAVDDVTAMSVEAHLMHCAPCRTLVPADQEWIDRSWADLRDVVDRPRPHPVERLLRALGLRDGTVKLLAATPRLYRAWLVSTVFVLVCALFAAHALPKGSLVFFLTAPVVPLAGVALAYGRGVDPAHTLTSITPMAGQRLLFLRTCAVLVPAVALCTLAALMMPSPTTPWTAVFWLLPSLTLVAGSLVLCRWVHLSLASGAVGLLWLVSLAVLGSADHTTPLSVVAPHTQPWWATALAALTGMLLLRLRVRTT